MVFLNIRFSANLVSPVCVYRILPYLITLKYNRHYPPETVRIYTQKIVDE